MSVLRCALFAIRIVIMNIEANNISLTIFDRDLIAFPDVRGTFILAGNASANEVGLVAEGTFRDRLSIVSVLIPFIIRVLQYDRIKSNTFEFTFVYLLE